MTENIDLNKIPEFSKNILFYSLIPLFPNNTPACLLNCLNSKLAQVVAFKKIKFQERAEQIPMPVNYYALNFVASGGGKNVILNHIDDYILPLFQDEYDKQDKIYRKAKMDKIEILAAKRFPNNENSRNNFITKEALTIGQIRYISGLARGSAEGLYSQLLVFQDANMGSPFYIEMELGGFMESCSTQEKGLLYLLLDVYDGKAYDKSIKSEKVTKNIKGVPVNLMFMSDSDKLLEPKPHAELMKYFGQGMIRRAFITYQPRCKVKVFRDPDEIDRRKDAAERYSKSQQQIIMNLLNEIPHEAVYKLQKEARYIYYNYIADCAETHNDMFGHTDNICLSDQLNRFWKMLKLSALIAAIEHPQFLIITPDDMQYAIYQNELFAQDFAKFFRATPTSDAERLYYYLYDHLNEWVTKTDINKQKFVHKDKFAQWLTENLEYVEEIAFKNGHSLIQESFGKNGTRFKLARNLIGQPLSPDVKGLDELL